MKIFLDDSKLPPDWTWIACRTVQHAIWLLSNPALERVTLISVAHDLANETAHDLIQWIEAEVVKGLRFVPDVIVHAGRPEDRRKIEANMQAIRDMLEAA